MFDSLSDRFDQIFTRLKSRGRLGAAEVEEVLGEIRVALLDADVNLDVITSFLDKVRARCTGAALAKSLTPAQQVIKIVNEELTATLGGEAFRFQYASRPPTVVLLAGLQGTGKTTAAAKLARYFKQQGRHPLLVGADLQRPAAVEQLRVLGREIGVAVFSEPTDPVGVARRGIEEALRVGRDVVIVDTAGRTTIDEALMAEVREIASAVKPHYAFLIVDAMTGQDAATTARRFHEAVPIDGIILSKLDGDARGGAALSARQVVGRPIVFASTGERPEDFEAFHPDRMASRILGMGDVLSLIERAEREFDEDATAETMRRLQSGRFTLEDFAGQIQQMRKMGPLQSLVGMLPGLPKGIDPSQVDERDVDRAEAIIRSMTPAERADPQLINGSRRARIATGSGTSTTQVNNLLRQFKEVQKLIRGATGLAGLGKAGRGRKQKGGRATPSSRVAG